MCSLWILSPRNRTIATSGISTYLPVGGDPRQHPVDLVVVREAEEHLVDDAVGADRAADRHQARVGRRGRDEVMLVEAERLAIAGAAGHHRHVVDVRLADHGGHGLVGVAGGEFELGVAVPDGVEVVTRPEHAAEKREGPRIGEFRRRLVVGVAVGRRKTLAGAAIDVGLARRLTGTPPSVARGCRRSTRRRRRNGKASAGRPPPADRAPLRAPRHSRRPRRRPVRPPPPRAPACRRRRSRARLSRHRPRKAGAAPRSSRPACPRSDRRARARRSPPRQGGRQAAWHARRDPCPRGRAPGPVRNRSRERRHRRELAPCRRRSRSSGTPYPRKLPNPRHRPEDREDARDCFKCKVVVRAGRHPGESRGPVLKPWSRLRRASQWIPAAAGMTECGGCGWSSIAQVGSRMSELDARENEREGSRNGQPGFVGTRRGDCRRHGQGDRSHADAQAIDAGHPAAAAIRPIRPVLGQRSFPNTTSAVPAGTGTI